MTEIPHLQVLSSEALGERVNAGLLSPIESVDDIGVMQCGDRRFPTDAAAKLLDQEIGPDIHPVRFFGVSSGMALVTLITITAQTDEATLKGFVDNYSPEALVDLAANISDRAHRDANGLWIVQHSAASNEGNDTTFAAHHHGPLGCKLNEFAGMVVKNAGSEGSLGEAKDVTSQVGTSLPLDEVRESALVLGKYVPEHFSVHRKALFKAINSERHTPFVVLQDAEVPVEQTAVVYDMGGYRSDPKGHAQSDIHRFHHTPRLAPDILTQLLPEFKLDPRLLEAAALLLGTATRATLSGEQNPNALAAEIIPAEYSKIA